MFRNAKGLTLIEILLTMALVSIIGIIIWSVFFQGIQFSTVVKKNTHLQQEVNLILTTLTRVHRNSSESYTITYDKSEDVPLIDIQNDKLEEFTFNNENYLYTIEVLSPDLNKWNLLNETGSITIYPNQNDLSIKIKISDLENSNLNYEIQTTISKIKR